MKHSPSKTASPPWPATRENRLAGKLMDVLEESFRRTAGNMAVFDRSIAVSREILSFYPKGAESEGGLREILAAKALGLMQSMEREERTAFLKSASGRVAVTLETEMREWPFGERREGESRCLREEAIARICSFRQLAEDNFEIFRYICLQDAIEKDENEYYEMYAQPIISGEFPAAVIYARLVDAAIDPEKKILNVGRGAPYYNDRELMEVLKTMMTVYYPLADAMGLGTTLAVSIRRNATTILEGLLRRKAENGMHEDADREMLALYERCKDYYLYLEKEAEQLAKRFIVGGQMEAILSSLRERFGVGIMLASHTSNCEDIYRIKGPSGMFWKIRKYRKKGDAEYDIHRIKDVLAATIVVDGALEDARAVADRLVWHLKQRLKAKEINIKSIPRESGYEVPHVTCKAKVNEKEIPFEIQVRPAKIHKEAKTGLLSHAAKISGFITGQLVEKLKPTFQEMELANETMRLMREKQRAERRRNAFRHRVSIVRLGNCKRGNGRAIDAYRGECVGGVVALALNAEGASIETKIEIMDAEGGQLPLT
ncbi:MAG: hypothetical protein QXH30_00205, partial [Candidatus Bilamarchaeaceae archaeon]